MQPPRQPVAHHGISSDAHHVIQRNSKVCNCRHHQASSTAAVPARSHFADALQSVKPLGAHVKNAGLRPRVPDTEATAFQKLIQEACYSLSLTPFPPHNKRRTIRRDLPLYKRYNGQLYAGFPNLFPPKETQCRLFIYFISPAPAATSLVGWSGVMVGCHAKADGHLPRIVGV